PGADIHHRVYDVERTLNSARECGHHVVDEDEVADHQAILIEVARCTGAPLASKHAKDARVRIAQELTRAVHVEKSERCPLNATTRGHCPDRLLLEEFRRSVDRCRDRYR